MMSTADTLVTPAIPVELWMRILEFVVVDDPDIDPQQVILPLMTVCRRWKMWAEDRFYERIEIKSYKQLAALERCVTWSSATHDAGVDLGSKITSLIIGRDHGKGYTHSDDPWGTILSILVRTPHLHTFAMLWSFARSAQVVALSNLKGPVLTSLELRLGEFSAGVLPLLNRFPTIRHLSLHLHYLGRLWAPGAADALRLPHLASFKWDSEAHTEVPSSTFLSACRFAPSCAVELHMVLLTTGDARRLIPFFAAHTFRALTFKVVDQRALAPLISELERIPSVMYS